MSAFQQRPLNTEYWKNVFANAPKPGEPLPDDGWRDPGIAPAGWQERMAALPRDPKTGRAIVPQVMPGSATYGSGFTDANGQPYQTLGGMAGAQDGSQYDPKLKAWMDDIFAKATGGQRKPRPDEYEQWIGPRGYVNSETDAERGLTPGSPAPYWANRMTLHAQGNYNGDNPAYDGGISGGGGGFSANGQNGVASFNAPGLLAPYTKEFQPTDINSILQAPAYQAAQANGVDQIQRGAAARGTLLTGGTLKDLAGYTQGLALGELNNQFNRDATTYGTNRDTFYGNQNNAYNKLSGFANTGLAGANSLADQGSGYANRAQIGANNLGNLATGQGDASAQAGINNAANTNNTLGALAQNIGGFDWASLFKGKKATIPQIPTNTGGSPTGGAAVPGMTR